MDKKKVVYPYIPNSVPHIQEEMLKEIGAESIDEFFECIPEKVVRLDRNHRTFVRHVPLQTRPDLPIHR